MFKELGFFLLGFILAWYFSQLKNLMPLYRSDFWSGEYMIAQEPQYFYTWLLHGNTNMVRGHFAAALMDYLEARIHDPTNFKVHYNLSAVYICLKMLQEAQKEVEICWGLECFGQKAEQLSLLEERAELFDKINRAHCDRKPLHLTIEEIGFLV